MANAAKKTFMLVIKQQACDVFSLATKGFVSWQENK